MATTAAKDYDMPFGKHQGQWICDLPTQYLVWASENCSFRDKNLAIAIAAELEYREEVGQHSRGIDDRAAWRRGQQTGSAPSSEDVKATLKSVIQRWHMSGMRDLHPDKNSGRRDIFQAFQKQVAKLKDDLAAIGIHVDLQV